MPFKRKLIQQFFNVTFPLCLYFFCTISWMKSFLSRAGMLGLRQLFKIIKKKSSESLSQIPLFLRYRILNLHVKKYFLL